MADMNGFLANLQTNPMFLGGMMGLSAANRGDPMAPAAMQGFLGGQTAKRTGLAERAHGENQEWKRLQMQQLQGTMARRQAKEQALKGFLGSTKGQELTEQFGLGGAPAAFAGEMLPDLMKAQITAGGKKGSMERNVEYLIQEQGYSPAQAIATVQKMGSTNIQLPGQQHPFDAALAADDLKRTRTGRDDADSARQSLTGIRQSIDAFGEILKTGDTGAWAPAKLFFAKYLGMGDTEGIPAQELFTVETGNMVMDRISQTKGAVSEKEMAYFQEISPGLGRDPFSNFAVLKWAEQEAELRIHKARAREEWLREARSLGPLEEGGPGFQEAWDAQAPEIKPLSELRADFDRYRGALAPQDTPSAQATDTPLSAAPASIQQDFSPPTAAEWDALDDYSRELMEAAGMVRPPT